MNHLIQPGAAIIFANWHEGSASDLDWQGMPMVEPILDRSMLQLVLERIVREGCKEIHVVLGDQPWLVRDLLGNGERWGCSITCHCVRSDEQIGEFAARIQPDPEDYYWLVDASSLLELGWQDSSPGSTESQGYAACYLDSGQQCWAGWAFVRGNWLADCKGECGFAGLESVLLSDPAIHVREVAPPLQVREFADFLHAAMTLLRDGARFGYGATLPPPQSGGIWISRDCSIHSEAVLIPPLFLGRGVKVESGVKLGPDLVVGDDSYIAREAHVSQSIVLSHSFVGERTEISRVVVKGSHCHHSVYQASLKIDDAGIIAPAQVFFDWGGWKARVTAQSLRLVLAPLYLLIRLLSGLANLKQLLSMPGQKSASEEMPTDRLLESAGGGNWSGALQHHFIAAFYPGLAAVARGRLDLVGPRMRSPEEIQALPPEWAAIYRQSRCGILQEALLVGSVGLSEDIQFMSDAFASRVPASPLRLLLRYLIAVVRDAWSSGLKENAVLDAAYASRKLNTHNNEGAHHAI